MDIDKLLTEEIRKKYLDTSEQRNNIIEMLSFLKANEGWVFIERILQIRSEAIASQILGTLEMNPEVEKDLKKDRMAARVYSQLPDLLITAIAGRTITNKVDDEVYD